MRINIPWGLHAYQDRSLPVNAQKLINFFIEAQPQDSKNPIVVNNTPGSTLFVTVGSGPIWGMKVLNDVLYAVSGAELYSITQAGVTTLIGAINGNARCSMEHNGTQLIIVNGARGYIYEAGTLTQILDASFTQFTVTRAVFLETRFLFFGVGTRTFFCSNSFDGLNYDALFFALSVTDPEDIISIIADHGEVWLFGKKGTEIWVYNRQEADFPYSKIDGSFVEKGCAAVHTPQKIDNSFFWLGSDLVIYRADGYKPTRISTHAIEHKIKGYARVDNAYANTFSEQGHYFYEITFPGIATWRYDASTGLWHQGQEGNSGQYHASCYEFFNDANITGDYRNGNIYTLDMSVYTDNGGVIYRTASTPHIHSGRLRASMDRLEIDIASGEGLTVGQGADPQLMMQYSDDGGRTWSAERWANMGRIGEYTRRVRFQQLGMFYQRMFQITLSDPIKPVIIDSFAFVDVEDVYD